jgi:hypothetical protein
MKLINGIANEKIKKQCTEYYNLDIRSTQAYWLDIVVVVAGGVAIAIYLLNGISHIISTSCN